MKERILRLCARGKIAINLRNLEHLQTHAGEDEEFAWRRLRPKLSYTGRQLDEVFLMEPSAVPATGGTTAPTPQPPAGENGGDILAAGAVHSRCTRAAPACAPTPTPTPRPRQPGSSARRYFRWHWQSLPDRASPSNPPTSPLNLIGKLEGWGIGPATPVAEVSIKVSAATGAQLKELLKKLPDGMTFELSLEKEDN
jgi:hypothetical protein